MFPSEGFSNEQIEEGFTLIDLSGSGKIVFSDFCEVILAGVHLAISTGGMLLHKHVPATVPPDIRELCSGGWG